MITASELVEAARLPLLELGARANAVREAAYGDRVYFCASPAPALEIAVPYGADLVASLLAVQPDGSVEPRIVATAGETAGEAEIRLIALARLAYPPTVHVRANWMVLTDAIAQVALRFGADELTGFPRELDRREIWRVIREAGREPYPCDSAYSLVDLPEPAAKLQVLPV
jgi:hypothetical protein